MARYGGYHPKLLVTGIPKNFSVHKLRFRLEEISGPGSVIETLEVTKTCTQVTVEDFAAQKKLLSRSVTISFGGKTSKLNVEKVERDSSDETHSGINEEEDEEEDFIFTFEAHDKQSKAILRYLSKNAEQKKVLRTALRKCDSKLKDISSEEIKAMLPTNHQTQHSPKEICEKCIKDFLADYSSWNEKLDGCSNANEKHIISMLSQYKDKCFGNWYTDSSTILVTGPKKVVEELRELVQKHLADKKTLPSVATAQPFEYEEVQPAIMRFVSKQKHFHDQMVEKMRNHATVEMKENKKNITIHLVPNERTRVWLHSDFENYCGRQLKKFFEIFDTWKGKFDPVFIETQKKMHPQVFKTEAYPDHYVQWHMDTGIVNVTGTRDQVLRCQTAMKNMGISSLLSPNKSPFMITPLQIPPQIYSVGEPVRRRSRTSPSGSYEEQSSPYSTDKILFNAEEIPVPILKFVSKNATSRKQLKTCCGKLANVSIGNDHGQIKVYITFKKKNFMNEDKAKAFDLVDAYFKLFDTTTMTYSAEKLKKVVAKQPQLFSSKPGDPVYIMAFPEKGNVKITGQKENFLNKVKEIDEEMECEVEEEMLPVDVFIAQRECSVWERVEQECRQRELKISLSSMQPGKIQYKGCPEAIAVSKKILGEISEKLCEKEIEGFSEQQITFLRKCKQSQHDFVKTNENILDSVYRQFKANFIHGSLAFQDSTITLISVNADEWRKGNEILRNMVQSIDIDLSNKRAKTKKSIKKKLENLPVHIEEQNLKKMQVYCFEDMKKEIREIRDRACDVEVVEKFYPMSEEMAKHIIKRKSINAIKVTKQKDAAGQYGLSIKCDKEDIDAVEMGLEDLKLTTVTSQERIPGYSLHEFLAHDEKHLKIERDTNCSIFLKQDGGTKTQSLVTIKIGNILDESCDAIVNSTGKNLSSGGQVSRALERMYSREVMQATLANARLVIQDQLRLCRTSGLLPWQYIFNIATPKERQALKRAILRLLQNADKIGVKSIALPTIGTGNMRLEPSTVATCMKEAFSDFASEGNFNLKDIRVVVYDASLYPVFKDISPTGESLSSGVVATIWGNNQEEVDQAMKMLKELCSKNIQRIKINAPEICGFSSYVKSRVTEICVKCKVHLEWKKNGTQEQCHLKGIVDNVSKANEEIDKLLETDFPDSWSPMMKDEQVVKVRLETASDEYVKVKTKFEESSPQYDQILRIERIQNPSLYTQFKARRDIKRKENSTQSVTKLLFHGTAPDIADKICGAGFDRNYAGTHGTLYGRGVYFAVNSNYSVRYGGGSGQKCIFLADVITGDYVIGRPDYRSPPEKRNSRTLYDSVVNNETNPSIFVVFRDSSAYPLYLITLR